MIHVRDTGPRTPSASAPRVAALLVSVAAGALGIVPLAGQAPRREQLLDYMEQIRNENDLPGLSVAVAVDGQIAFSEGVGYAELDNRTPATGRTVHNVGSVSKVLSVVGLMKLVEEGKVDLDATIQTYLPYYPEKEHPITVRQILTHTSGTRHYRQGEFGPDNLLQFKHFDTFEEATRLWRDDPLLFEPGTAWMYSSQAQNLQQGIVEAASGLGFEDYLKRYVFEPAGMMATQLDVPERVVQNRGHGYVRDRGGRFIHATPEDPSYKYAGGGILSNVEDLVRLCLALDAGRILGQSTIREMWRPQIDPGIMEFVPGGEPRPLGHEQALAWWIRTDQAGRRYPSHTGTVKGTRSFVACFPDFDIAVALQTNALPFDSATYGEAIAEMFLPPARAEDGTPR